MIIVVFLFQNRLNCSEVSILDHIVQTRNGDAERYLLLAVFLDLISGVVMHELSFPHGMVFRQVDHFFFFDRDSSFFLGYVQCCFCNVSIIVFLLVLAEFSPP